MVRRIDRPWTRLAITVTGIGALAFLATGTPSSASPGAQDERADPTIGTPAPTSPLRLVTGDILRINDGPDGRPGVVVDDVAHAGGEPRAGEGELAAFAESVLYDGGDLA